MTRILSYRFNDRATRQSLRNVLPLAGLFLLVGMIAVLTKMDRTALALNAHLNFHALITFVANHFLTPYFPIFLGLVLFLEWLKPSGVRGGLFSKGFAYDASIGLFTLAFQFLAVNLVMGMLFKLYAIAHVPVLGPAVHRWNNWVVAVFSLTVSDFFNWASHLVRHKVPQLWRFHAMHHSQRELNIFTELRNHPMDSLTSSVIQSLPLYLMQVPFTISVTCLVIYKYYLMFTHANVDMNYGFVGRLLVSPRFHRVHHGRGPEFYDHNFGAVLSIWDGMFGTSKSFPTTSIETGTDDFPAEHDRAFQNPLPLYLRQLVKPFESGEG